MPSDWVIFDQLRQLLVADKYSIRIGIAPISRPNHDAGHVNRYIPLASSLPIAALGMGRDRPDPHRTLQKLLRVPDTAVHDDPHPAVFRSQLTKIAPY